MRYNGNNLVYLRNADWNNEHLVWDLDAEELWLPAETKNLEGTALVLNGKTEQQNLGYTVGELMDLGFVTETDVSVPVESRFVCEVFQMTKADMTFYVRAVNPYSQSTHEFAGIDKDRFHEYFCDCKNACAYVLGSVVKYETPKSLDEYGLSLAPQSFIYIVEE